MTPCVEQQEYRRAELVFKREELFYDIGNYAYVEGDVMPTEDAHSRHQAMDVTDEGNAELATRTLNLAHSEAAEALYPYTKMPLEDGTRLDDTLEEPKEYVLELKVPRTFSKTSLQYLRNLVHEYMVSRVLYEWMSLTNQLNQQSRRTWEEKSTLLKEKIRGAVRRRYKSVRIRQHPF